MSQKYTRSEIAAILRKERLPEKVRGLVKQQTGKQTLKSGDAKKELVKIFANKSARQRKKEFDKLGMSFRDRVKYTNKWFGKGRLSKHEENQLRKKMAKIKNRNIALTQRQREEMEEHLSPYMSQEELDRFNPKKKSAKIGALREGMSAHENVKDTAQNRLGVNYREGVSNFAGGVGKRKNVSSTGNNFGGGGGSNPQSLTGGPGMSPGGGGLLKFK